MPLQRGKRGNGGTAHRRWATAVLATYGDVCHICGHGGARQADHLIPETERPDLRLVVSNGRPAHGSKNKCPVCGQHCNQLRGYGSVQRAQRLITERTGVILPENVPNSVPPDTRNAGRDWLPSVPVGPNKDAVRQRETTRGRHARPKPERTPGPVTAVFRVARKREPKPVAFALRAWPAIPPLFLIVPVLRHSANTADYAGNVLGADATLALLACISITPLMTVMKARAAKLRWWYGTWMFELGAAGLAITLIEGKKDLAAAAAGSSAAWTGTLIVTLLLPMTIMSNAAAQKLLGPEWKRWQRGLIWFVWVLVGLHVLILRAWPFLAGFALMSAPLIIFRSGRVRRSVKAWRSGRYSTGGWWFALGALVSCYAAGFIVLLAETGLACARATGGA